MKGQETDRYKKETGRSPDAKGRTKILGRVNKRMSEGLDDRRQALLDASKKRASDERQNTQQRNQDQQQRNQAKQDREDMKKEIKHELRTGQ